MIIIQQPNFTQCPNAVLDCMGEFSDSELRVLLFMCRQTFGWRREKTIPCSASFIAKATGMSQRGVTNGLNGLIDRKVIQRHVDGKTFAYSIVVSDAPMHDLHTSAEEPTQTVHTSPMHDLHTNKESCGKKEKKESDNYFSLLPEPLRTPPMEEAWKLWAKHRIEIGHPLTKTGVTVQAGKLAPYPAPVCVAAIQSAIERGYRGIFPESLKAPPAARPTNGAELTRQHIAAVERGDDKEAKRLQQLLYQNR